MHLSALASQYPCPVPAMTRLHHTLLCSAFYVGSGYPNSGPHSCTVSTLLLTAIVLVTSVLGTVIITEFYLQLTYSPYDTSYSCAFLHSRVKLDPKKQTLLANYAKQYITYNDLSLFS